MSSGSHIVSILEKMYREIRKNKIDPFRTVFVPPTERPRSADCTAGNGEKSQELTESSAEEWNKLQNLPKAVPEIPARKAVNDEHADCWQTEYFSQSERAVSHGESRAMEIFSFLEC